MIWPEFQRKIDELEKHDKSDGNLTHTPDGVYECHCLQDGQCQRRCPARDSREGRRIGNGDVMPHISILSLDGTVEGASPIHKVTLAGSNPYVHSEMKFPDGLSFSAEIGIGARFKDIHYSHPERWHEDIIYLLDPAIERIRIRAELMVAMGLKYDFAGAISSPFTGYQNPGKVFCSESIGYCLAPDLIDYSELKNFHPVKLQIIAHALSLEHGIP